MTVLKTPYKYWIERSFVGRPSHLCDSCLLLGKCTRDGAYRQRGVLGKSEWEVVGCSEYAKASRKERIREATKVVLGAYRGDLEKLRDE